MRSFSFLAFVVLTFCCWGVYGPVLHIGQELMGEGPGKLSSLRPLICVGIAYFLIAVVYPLIVLKSTGEKGSWSAAGFIWSFVAGAVGAVGALGIILAFKFQGKPVYVMPLVFGLAPIVNTFVTMLMSGTIKQASLRFYLGILIVAVGAAGVLSFKPIKPKPAPTDKTALHAELPALNPVVFQENEQEKTGGQQQGPDKSKPDSTAQPPAPGEDAAPPQQAAPRPVNNKLAGASVSVDEERPEGEGNDGVDNGEPKWDDVNDDDDEMAPPLPLDDDPEDPADNETVQADSEKDDVNLWLVAMCIGVTALCWGAYGPVLHKGQAKMEGSRLRPFLCVGLAYFAIAVIVPSILLPLPQFQEPGGWDPLGGFWSMLAGVAGAIGALGIIYAFNFGGKPIFVMPLVFGFAPVVNTLTETVSKNLLAQVSPMFLASLGMVIVGAVMVLVFAPRAPRPQPVPANPESAPS